MGSAGASSPSPLREANQAAQETLSSAQHGAEVVAEMYVQQLHLQRTLYRPWEPGWRREQEEQLLRKRLATRANHQGVLKAIEARRLEALAKRWAKDGATATPV
jgi:hypothetical protein